MVNPKDLKEAQSWFRQAESNYDFLSVAKESESYDLVCFLSQQVAEEALRAYLSFQGKHEISTHNLTELCEIARKYDEGFLRLKERIEVRNYFNIEAKHSDSVETLIPSGSFNQVEATEAMLTAKEVLDFVRDKLTSVLGE